ncbi:MAG: phosphoadenosine phosphosulfate reductase domain-containing protein [Thermoplasmataceae archaeon]
MTKEKICVVSVSGGKDSTATLLLALERKNNVKAVFADTGNEHPLTYDYLDYLREKLGIVIHVVKSDFSRQMAVHKKFILEKWPLQGIPDEKVQRAANSMVPSGVPFLDLCVWKGRFPGRVTSRFCTKELKTLPLTAYALSLAEDGSQIESWQGIRKDESRTRATYPERERVHESIEIYRPILDWKAADTFAFAKKKGIKPNPLYLAGQTRVGCMPCINTRKDSLRHIGMRFPEVIERIKEWELLVGEASKRDSATFFCAEVENEIAYREGNILKKVGWAVGKRPSLFLDHYEKELELEMDGCSSSFGLCE